jgi:hypothetical protein
MRVFFDGKCRWHRCHFCIFANEFMVFWLDQGWRFFSPKG